MHLYLIVLSTICVDWPCRGILSCIQKHVRVIYIVSAFCFLFIFLRKVTFTSRDTSTAGANSNTKFLLPLPQTMMLPLLSPVRTSPLWLNATQVTYLGFSLLSKMPIRLYSMPPLSRDQKDTCPFPQDTIWFRSSGCHSAHTTVSTEHCNWQSSFIKWAGSGFESPWSTEVGLLCRANSFCSFDPFGRHPIEHMRVHTHGV